jgi:hypothetical protein
VFHLNREYGPSSTALNRFERTGPDGRDDLRRPIAVGIRFACHTIRPQCHSSH